MRISNRTIFAVAGVLALLTISARLQSTTPASAPVDGLAVAPRSEPPVAHYVDLRGSSATSRRAAAEVAEPTPRRTDTSRPMRLLGQSAAEPAPVEAPVLDEPTTPEPAVSAGSNGFDDSGMLASITPAAPSQPGELTDQAVFELFVSSLDTENRRAFRSTWALMSAEERQEWIVGARSALNN